MTILLPPGSTSTDLQNAIDGATSGDTVILSGDMPFSEAVTVPAGKEIAVQSDTGNNWIMTTIDIAIRHFEVYGSLLLQNITLDGVNVNGGIYIRGAGSRLTLNDGAVLQNCNNSGVYGYDNAELIMNKGAVIQNCESGRGGGVNMEYRSMFTMNGGSILNNTLTGNDTGGGVLIISYSTFVMYDGLISGNYALTWGGGVAANYYSSFTMSGGTIRNNEAKEQGFGGGGVAIISDSSFTMSGGKITENIATDGNGGGILLTSDCTVNISGESYITNNSAPNGEGGGIYIYDAVYSTLTIAAKTVFSCNRAQNAYKPPEDAAAAYPNILFASTSIADHPLNNYDIHYTGTEPLQETFHVTYHANGGSGRYVGPETAPGSTDMVLAAEAAGISRVSHDFISWNTQPDGSGTAYMPGDAITLQCSTVLFAQWAGIYTVTYDCNGGRGHYIDRCKEFDIVYRILSTNQTGISRTNFVFTLWNTLPDGSGISYAAGDVITINSNVILYAQWVQIPTQKKRCRKTAGFRTAVEGQKIWIDNNNAGNTRPPSVEILLRRDGEIYKRTTVDSAGDGYFGFCCLPAYKNTAHPYRYQTEESAVPGYITVVAGYTVINTLAP